MPPSGDLPLYEYVSAVLPNTKAGVAPAVNVKLVGNSMPDTFQFTGDPVTAMYPFKHWKETADVS